MFPLSAFAAAPNAGTAKEIVLGETPFYITAEPGTNFIWVMNSAGTRLSIVDLDQGKVVDTIASSDDLWGHITLSPTHAYVPTYGTKKVIAIDLKTRKITETVTLDYSITGTALSTDEKILYAASYFSNVISVINTENHKLATTITIPGAFLINDLEYDTDTGLLYLLGNGERICIVDTKNNEYKESIYLGTTDINDIKADFANNCLYGRGNNLVRVVDLTQKKTINSIDLSWTDPDGLGGAVLAIAKAEGKRLYIVNELTKKVHIFDTSDVNNIKEIGSVDINLNSLGIGIGAGIAANEERQELYAYGGADAKVIVLKTAPTIAETSLSILDTTKLSLKVNMPLNSSVAGDTADIGYYISTDPKLSPTNLVGTKVEVKGNVDTFPFSFEKAIEGLTPNTTYYVMAYAHSSINDQTAYSEVMSAKTLNAYFPLSTNVPKTGDNSPMVVLFLIASASCLVLLNRYKKSVN